jgi:hypothetical protein
MRQCGIHAKKGDCQKKKEILHIMVEHVKAELDEPDRGGMSVAPERARSKRSARTGVSARRRAFRAFQ